MTGAELKAEFKKRGVRPEDVASDIGYSFSSIQRWLSLRTSIPYRAMVMLQAHGYIEPSARLRRVASHTQ